MSFENLQYVIDKLQAKADEIRYYKGKIEDPNEFFDATIATLETIRDHYENCSTIEEVEEREALAAQAAFKSAVSRIIEKVLKNSELKRRGDMIAAVEKMELDDGED